VEPAKFCNGILLLANIAGALKIWHWCFKDWLWHFFLRSEIAPKTGGGGELVVSSHERSPNLFRLIVSLTFYTLWVSTYNVEQFKSFILGGYPVEPNFGQNNCLTNNSCIVNFNFLQYIKQFERAHFMTGLLVQGALWRVVSKIICKQRP